MSDEPLELSPLQRAMYATVREDLAKIKEYEGKVQKAKHRYTAIYYGKKLAKLKGEVIGTLKYAEKFNSAKLAVDEQINTSREESNLLLPESKLILPGA